MCFSEGLVLFGVAATPPAIIAVQTVERHACFVVVECVNFIFVTAVNLRVWHLRGCKSFCVSLCRKETLPLAGTGRLGLGVGVGLCQVDTWSRWINMSSGQPVNGGFRIVDFT